MADRRDADGLSTVGQLIGSIRTRPAVSTAAELSAERVTGERVALEQAKRILDRIDQRPVQVQQVAPGSAGED